MLFQANALEITTDAVEIELAGHRFTAHRSCQEQRGEQSRSAAFHVLLPSRRRRLAYELSAPSRAPKAASKESRKIKNRMPVITTDRAAPIPPCTAPSTTKGPRT